MYKKQLLQEVKRVEEIKLLLLDQLLQLLQQN
jgi:hypothetical protein